MSARLDTLRLDLLATRDDLLALIDALAPGDLSRPTHNGYRDVHDTLAHLASAESGRILLTRACLLVYPLSVPLFVINLVNGFKDRKSTRLNSSHIQKSRMPSSA